MNKCVLIGSCGGLTGCYLARQFRKAGCFVIGADAIQFASSLKEGGINLVVFDPQKMECVGTEPYTVSDYQLQIRRI